MNLAEAALKKIATENQADIFMFSAEVNHDTADALITEIRSIEEKAENCILLLSTFGGIPDAGYRIARIIQKSYKRFILFVLGHCKSTGTLIALGAEEIVMGDYGELGPLDIQLTKDDELINTSGLSYVQSLVVLNDQLFDSFQSNFINLKRNSGYSITTRTAAEIGTKLSVGIIAPIAAQIDPIKLGEVQRAMSIANAYGRRICQDKDLVNTLIANYPSHGFVIDLKEAKVLFKSKKVRDLNEDEKVVENSLLHIFRTENQIPFVRYHKIDVSSEEQEDDNNTTDISADDSTQNSIDLNKNKITNENAINSEENAQQQ